MIAPVNRGARWVRDIVVLRLSSPKIDSEELATASQLRPSAMERSIAQSTGTPTWMAARELEIVGGLARTDPNGSSSPLAIDSPIAQDDSRFTRRLAMDDVVEDLLRPAPPRHTQRSSANISGRLGNYAPHVPVDPHNVEATYTRSLAGH
ncbi:MAG: hypothetical protein JWO62_2990 [Acidimicrobiaceae bacterium]|nr:hypothetical protein [Acidimicrobiaceae bacterium]